MARWSAVPRCSARERCSKIALKAAGATDFKPSSRKMLQSQTRIARSTDHPTAQSSNSRFHREITSFYTSLLARYGAQNWWPAQSRFEVIVGAYLTQNTNWSNVEKALRNLRRAGLFSLNAMRSIPLADLEALIRTSGYFRQKA